MTARYAASWTWRFAAPPDAVWQLLADTAQMNEALRTPKYALEEVPQPDGSVRRTGRARIGRLALEWDEQPCEWVAGRNFRQCRVFRRGPIRRLGAQLALQPDSGAGTVATYGLTAVPAGWTGQALLAAGFFRRTGRRLERIVKGIRAFLAGSAPQPFVMPEIPPDPAMRARIAGILSRMVEAGADAPLAWRLADHMLEGTDVALSHARPLRLAAAWGVPPRLMVETALLGVRHGLLGMSWDLLCPNCRGAKVSVPSLDRLPKGAHCPSCNIDYGTRFARNVELTIHPAPGLRVLAAGSYCLSGPMTTPHVWLQQGLAPGEVREVPADLPPGAWRLRTLEAGAVVDLDAATPLAGMRLEDEGPVAIAEHKAGRLLLENRTKRPRTLVIESREWVRHALTAHRASTLQVFRDLFSEQVLRPGDDVAIDQVALMFTDLRGSTALYRRIGDGPAYRLVRDHFALLARVVREHDGAVVKTIGDSIMAAFADPADAVRAALAARRAVGAGGGDATPAVRIGLHGGPCIAVTLNDRLDYFGSTVNLAARLEQQSRGGDVVVSDDLARDPAVAALLAGLPASRETASIKGLDAPVSFLRLVAAAQAGVPSAGATPVGLPCMDAPADAPV